MVKRVEKIFFAQLPATRPENCGPIKLEKYFCRLSRDFCDDSKVIFAGVRDSAAICFANFFNAEFIWFIGIFDTTNLNSCLVKDFVQCHGANHGKMGEYIKSYNIFCECS